MATPARKIRDRCKRHIQRPARALAAVMMALAVLAMIAPAALAQQAPKRKAQNLMEFLFGPRKSAPVQVPTRRSATKPKAAKPRATTPREPEIEILEKAPDARTVLVVGDFMGSGLAEGLNSAFAANPAIKVVDRANGSSGLVRDDYFDWPKQITTVIEAEKPAVVVVMIGSNDRQQMTINDTQEPPLSPGWVEEYQVRSQAFAAAVKKSSVPFIWVGQPSFKPRKMLADMLALNDIYRQAAEGAGGAFIDIWDGFVDENGAFVTNGPDINGQPARLRSDDGISLSRDGKRKIAFYTEKSLHKILGITPSGLPALDLLPQSAPIESQPIDRTAPLALTDPQLDGGAELLGQNPDINGQPRTAAERLAVDGIAPGASTGRADDFGP